MAAVIAGGLFLIIAYLVSMGALVQSTLFV